jgi:hypothetical protein
MFRDLPQSLETNLVIILRLDHGCFQNFVHHWTLTATKRKPRKNITFCIQTGPKYVKRYFPTQIGIAWGDGGKWDLPHFP